MRRHARALSADSTWGTGNGRVRFGRALAARGAGNADGSGASALGLSLVAIALLVSFLATASPAGAAERSLLGSFATETGEAGGKVGFGTGVAVNRAGTGGAGVGDVYVSDFQNARVDQFSAAGTFIRAFGWDVVASGEHNTGGFEICEAASSPADVCKAGSKLIANPGAVWNPEAIAVDQATGNVFVASNNGNRRIDVFSAEGSFEGAFGWGVRTGAAALEFCTTASGCLTGTASASPGAFSNLLKAAIAVDPSNGHLYVGERGNLRINEFSFTLNGSNEVTGVGFVRSFGSGQFPTNTPTSIAIDSNGFVYAVTAEGTCNGTTNICRVQKFNPDGTFKETFGPSTGGAAACQLTWTAGAANAQGPNGIAVDPTDQHVYVTRKVSTASFELCEFDSSGTLISRSPGSPLETNVSGYLKPAIGSSIYVNAPIQGQRGAIFVLGSPPPLPGATALPATGVATTSATLNGRVTVPAPGGFGYATGYHFELSPDNGQHWQSMPVPDKSVGSQAGVVDVSLPVSELLPNRTYRYRLVATNAAGSTTSSELLVDTLPAPPSIAHTRALPVTDTTATLRASVNPNSSPTVYRFQWGETTSYGSQAPSFEPFAGEGGQLVGTSAGLTGLKAGTIYHFRLVATNAFGTSFGPDTTFTTSACPVANAAGLPSCRAIELVSPPDQGPVGESGQYVALASNLQTQASADGSSIAYQVAYGFSDATSGGEVLYKAVRGGSGWASSQLSPPSLIPAAAPEEEGAESGWNLYLAEDLECGFLNSYGQLSPEASTSVVEEGGTNLYRSNPDGSYTVITKAPASNPGAEPAPRNNGFKVYGASADCDRVVFASRYRYPGIDFSGLYEWEAGTLRNAGVVPGPSGPVVASTALPGAVPGAGSEMFANAVSDDGSRFYFTAQSEVGADAGNRAIFLREGGATIDVSQSEVPSNPTRDARFQTASADGSRAFFLANYGLTSAPSNGLTTANCIATAKAECDLYEYDAETGDLTDLTATTAPGNPKGAVVEGVLASSDDGSHVYFAAQGQLVPGRGNTYAENVAGAGAYNIYLSRAGELIFVATLPAADFAVDASAPGLLISGRGNETTQSENWTSAATPDGGSLLFQSGANLTGYESGGVIEAYLYSAASDTLVCVSCRTDGQPSVGYEPGKFPFEKKPLRGRRAGIANYDSRPRMLSDDGKRVFFMMPDALAPGAVDGNRNLYQWEQGQIALLATRADTGQESVRYMGASRNGDSVFFATAEKLSPEDVDGRRSLYVARVGGGFAPPPQLQPCDPLLEGSCQGPSGASPGQPAPPASSTSSSGGNAVGQAGSGKTKKGKKKKAKGKKAKGSGKGKARRANKDREAGK